MKVQLLIFCAILIASEVLSDNSSRIPSNPSYGCDLSSTGLCQFYGISLTSTSTKYQPTVSGVTDIHMGGSSSSGGSKMTKFTSDLCYAFPYIYSINADYLGISSIDSDAFSDCSWLHTLKFSYNSLTSLSDVNVFKTTKIMKILHFYANKITTIDPAVINDLVALEELSFGANNLVDFPIERFNTFNRMKKLYLDNNQFTDINEVEIMRKFPNLEYFHICPNTRISSSRMSSILSYMNSKGVNTNSQDC